jgi:hypothetical protein
MFWGVNLKQGESYYFKGLSKRTLSIDNVCLTKDSDNEKFYVTLTTKGKEFSLTVLQKDKVEAHSLLSPFTIEEGMKLAIKCSGKGEVSITGHFEDIVSDAYDMKNENNKDVNEKKDIKKEEPKKENKKEEPKKVNGDANPNKKSAVQMMEEDDEDDEDDEDLEIDDEDLEDDEDLDDDIDEDEDEDEDDEVESEEKPVKQVPKENKPASKTNEKPKETKSVPKVENKPLKESDEDDDLIEDEDDDLIIDDGEDVNSDEMFNDLDDDDEDEKDVKKFLGKKQKPDQELSREDKPQGGFKKEFNKDFKRGGD